MISFYYSLQRSTTNGSTHNKHLQTINNIDSKSDMTLENEYNQYIIPNSCIIKIEPPSDENENILIDGDSIQQIMLDDMNLSIMNQNLSSTLRSSQLDAIVEDSNEESSDDLDETIQPVR